MSSITQVQAGPGGRTEKLVDEMIEHLNLKSATPVPVLEKAIYKARSYWVSRLQSEVEENDIVPRINSLLVDFSESTFMATVFWFVINKDNKVLPSGVSPVDEVAKLVFSLRYCKLYDKKPTIIGTAGHTFNIGSLEAEKSRRLLRHYQMGLLLSERILTADYTAEYNIWDRPDELDFQAQTFALSEELSVGSLNSIVPSLHSWLLEYYFGSADSPGSRSDIDGYSGWLIYLAALYDVISHPENIPLKPFEHLANTPYHYTWNNRDLYYALASGMLVSIEDGSYRARALLESLSGIHTAYSHGLEQAAHRESMIAGLFTVRRLAIYHNMLSAYRQFQIMESHGDLSPDLDIMEILGNEGDLSYVARHLVSILDQSQLKSGLMAIRLAALRHEVMKNHQFMSYKLILPAGLSDALFPLWRGLWPVTQSQENMFGWGILYVNRGFLYKTQEFVESTFMPTASKEVLKTEEQSFAQIIQAQAQEQAQAQIETTPTDSGDNLKDGVAQKIWNAVFMANLNFTKKVLADHLSNCFETDIEGQYRKEDHLYFLGPGSLRDHYYRIVWLSPVQPQHWTKTKQPDGTKGLAETFPGDGEAGLLILNSNLPEFFGLIDTSKGIDKIVPMMSQESLLRFKRQIREISQHQLSLNVQVITKKDDLLEKGNNERIPRELPLPSKKTEESEESVIFAHSAQGEDNRDMLKSTPNHFLASRGFLMPPKLPDFNPAKEVPISERVSNFHEKCRVPGALIYEPGKSKTCGVYENFLDLAHAKTLWQGGNAEVFAACGEPFPFIKGHYKVAIKKTKCRLEEYLIATAVQHKNILYLLGCLTGESGGYEKTSTLCYFYPFYTGDLARGASYLIPLLKKYSEEPSLKDKVSKNFLHLFTQLCEGLNYLHNSQNVAHRDIKLGNILYRLECNCVHPLACTCSKPVEYVISDFDASIRLCSDGTLMKDLPRISNPFNTREKYHIAPVGTVGFKSPEGFIYSVTNSKDLLPSDLTKMDMFSLGKMALILFFGEQVKEKIDSLRELLATVKEVDGSTAETVYKEYGVIVDSDTQMIETIHKMHRVLQENKHNLEVSHSKYNKCLERERYTLSGSELSYSLVNLMKGCLKADPAQRPGVSELLKDLKGLTEPVMTFAAPTRSLESTPFEQDSAPSLWAFIDTGDFDFELPVNKASDAYGSNSESSPVTHSVDWQSMHVEDSLASSLPEQPLKIYQEALSNKLTGLNLQTRPTPGDFRCLIHAVAMQTGWITDDLTRAIRDKLRRWLAEQEAILKTMFSKGATTEAIQTQQDSIDSINALIGSIDHYHFLPPEILQFAADVTGTAINLYHPSMQDNAPVAEMSFTPQQGSDKVIFIAHNGINHYEAVTPVEASSEEIQLTFNNTLPGIGFGLNIELDRTRQQRLELLLEHDKMHQAYSLLALVIVLQFYGGQKYSWHW